ncbi:hypothetical protein MMC13_001440 [Lambiella insularis]|nr:hypothetical protein [Lambiella insularis]
MISSTLPLLLLWLPLLSAQSWTTLPGSTFCSSEAWGTCSSASWPQSNVGQQIQPQAPDAELKAMIAEVDSRRIQNIVTTLTAFGTRHTLSNQTDPIRGIGAARDWIYNQLQLLALPSTGNMEVEIQSYLQPVVAGLVPFPVKISNVVARINGTSDPNRVYVVTGHYDSRRIDILDYTGDAPGADDDATGVAVVMEMARICATRRPAATMIFAATAGEEQGLYGSNFLAQTLKNASANVEGNWNNDIVGTGSSSPFSPINDYTIRLFGASLLYPALQSASALETIGIIGGENDSPARNLGRFIAEITAGAAEYVDMQVALIYRPDRYLRGGDHESFLSAGFPAVRFTEAVEDFAHQHQDPRVQNGTIYGDLLEFVDFEYTARVAKVNLASMWSGANAPALPKNVSISTVVGFPASSESTPLYDISNDSQFTWTTGKDPLVTNYELV